MASIKRLISRLDRSKKNRTEDLFYSSMLKISLWTLLAFGASLLVSAASNYTDPETGKYITKVAIYSTFSVAVGIFLLYAAGELIGSITSRKSYLETFQRAKRIPSLVIFRKRKDIITLLDNGDAEFVYEHLIVCDSSDHIEALHFPVIADLKSDGSDFGDKVSIKDISVNGNPVTILDSYRSIEKRTYLDESTVPTEYGVIYVPVGLRQGISECNLSMTFTLEGVFNNIESDFVVIDIPYLTEELTVELRPNTSKKRIAPSKQTEQGQPIDAYGEMMDMYDHGESSNQSRQIDVSGTGVLIWTTNNTKVGYRYKIWFRQDTAPGNTPQSNIEGSDGT